MQTRRKKYSLVNRPGGVLSTFGTNPITASPFGNTPGPLLGVHVSSLASGNVGDSRHSEAPSLVGMTSDLLSDLDMVVGHDPGSSSSRFQVESNVHKSSVIAMYQDTQSSGDKLEMRLLVLDESERGKLMHKLVTTFHQKVLLCFDHYKPDLTLFCLRVVTSLSVLKHRPRSRQPPSGDPPETKHHRLTDPFAELDVEEALTRELPNFTVSRLRETVQQLLRRATLRQDGTLYFAGSSEDSMATRSVQYFIWFFDFMDFLHELFITFVEKIFNPLFKYFQDYSFLGSNGRTHSMSSAFSKFSHFSESDSQAMIDGDLDGRDSESMAEVRRKQTQAKASLLQLSKEYRDIKSIYDTTEIDKIAKRLSFVKEQLEFLLDEEDEVDPDLYSAESGKIVEHMNMDFGTENLIRLVPDILVKLKKAAWLARRWLELDDERTKDVNIKLEKLAAIEKQLVKRLSTLEKDIRKDEIKLDRDTNELNRLMEKEGRTDSLTLQSYNIDRDMERVKSQLELLNKEKETFATRLSDIVKSKDLTQFHALKFQFESNKLKRFVTERKLATMAYQKNLLADDLVIELFVRPSVIHSSNKLQDDCERLELQIRQQKDQLDSIKRALMPVQEDKASLLSRLARQREFQPPWHSGGSDAKSADPKSAAYVRSLPKGQTVSLPTLDRLPVLPRDPGVSNRILRNVSPPTW